MPHTRPRKVVHPVGVEHDPASWLAQVRAGASFPAFLVRRVHEPVSTVRSAQGAVL